MTESAAAGPTTITAYPDGPLVVRGPAVLVDEDGEPVERRRRTVALCRCGRSTIAPFCDGTHKASSRRRLRSVRDGAAPGRAEARDQADSPEHPDQEEDT